MWKLVGAWLGRAAGGSQWTAAAYFRGHQLRETILLLCWLDSLRTVCQSFSGSPVGTRDLGRREELQKESLRQAAAMLKGSHVWGEEQPQQPL